MSPLTAPGPVKLCMVPSSEEGMLDGQFLSAEAELRFQRLANASLSEESRISACL